MYKALFFILLGLLLTSSVIANDCYPPAITNLPASISESHCSTIVFDFDAQLDPLDNQSNTISYSSSIGSIDSDGLWTYDPVDADVHNPPELIITVSNGTCENQYPIPFEVTNEAPVITNWLNTIAICENGRYPIRFLDIDNDCDEIGYAIVAYSGMGTVSLDINIGGLIINEPLSGYYYLEIQINDGIDTNYYYIDIEVVGCVSSQVHLTDAGEIITLGQMAELKLFTIMTSLESFNLCLSYYGDAMSFVGLEPYDFLEEYFYWEYFNYEVTTTTYTEENHPINLLRIKGMANYYDTYFSGDLADLNFLMTNDPNFECEIIPIKFFWESCNDNILKNRYGTFVSDYIKLADFQTEISDSTTGYPTTTGVQGIGSCEDNANINYRHALNFANYELDIACVDPVPRRGDINLNGVPYEIADAVLLTNFFIKGIIVFDINPNAQLEQSDINADGYNASIADLVYLYRIIFGEVYSYPKLSPFQTKISHNNGVVNVRDEIGAAFIISKGNAQPELIAQNMTLDYHYDETNDQTRILIYSTNPDNSFAGDFLRLENEISSIELASKDGAIVPYDFLPAQVLLHQNHPNPFNPTTTISFDLPHTAFATITIYNITGQKVKEIMREFAAGINQIEWDGTDYASGIYYYKIETEGYVQTKKMMLIK